MMESTYERRFLFFFLFLTFVDCQLTRKTCPADIGWLTFNGKCYKFVAFPRLDHPGASAACQENGATLLSVNTPEEHQFVANWLLTNDQRRGIWLTSGVTVTYGIRWQGDGSINSSLDTWMPNTAIVFIPGQRWRFTDDFLRVVYNYTGIEYLWNVGIEGEPYSFVCEISIDDVDRIFQQRRDFDYGLNVDNPTQAPRGPTFLQEPQDTIVFGSPTTVYLQCLAQANPEASYNWLKLSNDYKMIPLEVDPRYSFTTGLLEIRSPSYTDESTYMCKASNDYGTVISSSARLTFGELGDFSNVIPSPVMGGEYEGVNLECPPINGKPSKTYQWYKTESLYHCCSRRNILTPSNHTFISANGNLYFSELSLSDQGTYFCFVTQSSWGQSGIFIGESQTENRTSIGQTLRVRSATSSLIKPVIPYEFIYLFPWTPIRGGNVRLECFAYGTGPLKYTWSREGGRPLPKGYVLESNDRILLLKNLELTDGGNYTCKVFSTSTNLQDTKTIDLKIQAKPYFTYPLTHQHVDLGSRLTWHCEAAGRPTPTYQWYKNGEVLKSSPGITVDVNTLTITAVDGKRDNGMYQCTATNRYGPTFSTAQLRVLEIKPNFDKTPMIKTQSGAVGGNVTIICDPVAAPMPTYVWLKDGSNLNLQPGVSSEGDHYRMLLNGSLLIQGLQLSDQGRYTCQVENKVGKAEDYTELQVLDGQPQNDAEIDFFNYDGVLGMKPSLTIVFLSAILTYCKLMF